MSWHVLLVPATWEAEGRGLFEPESLSQSLDDTPPPGLLRLKVYEIVRFSLC